MQFQFTVPEIICAFGAAKSVGVYAKAAGCGRILCVYDKGVEAAGLVAPVLDAIRESGLSVRGFDEVMPDPPIEAVEKAVLAARDFRADAVVAIGGGSTLDTGKLTAALSVNPGRVQDYYVRDSMAVPALPLFTIPTTSGTGSEVTPAAVVSDPALGRKVTLVDAKLIPRCSILDPALTLGLPRLLTAAAGMDALSHAVESMTSIRHNPMTDGIALAAIRLIVRYLPVCAADGKNEEARANMMIASTMAGMAFGNTCTHVGHALAHAMGAKWHIPHGTACALALPFAVRNCAPAAGEQLAAIAEAVGLSEEAAAAGEALRPGQESGTMAGELRPQQEPPAAAGTVQLAERLADWFREFASTVGVPTLSEMGIDPGDLDGIVEMTLGEKPLILLSGVPVTREDCRAYYEELFAQKG